MSDLFGYRLSETYTAAELAARGFQAGQNVTDASTGKVYKLVKYNSGAGAVAAVAGNACYYYAVSGASAGQTTEVTSDVTDSVGVGAGVLQAVIASGSFGWVQIKGVATLTTALTAGADGNALTAVGAGDGTLDVSALVTDAICAYAIDASAKIIMCDFPE
jgi:hypothetical protein